MTFLTGSAQPTTAFNNLNEPMIVVFAQLPRDLVKGFREVASRTQMARKSKLFRHPQLAWMWELKTESRRGKQLFNTVSKFCIVSE